MSLENFLETNPHKDRKDSKKQLSNALGQTPQKELKILLQVFIFLPNYF
jgi:hypothetical protein